MLDREGAAGPADIAIVGSADEVAERVLALADVGVTDFAAVEFGGDPDEVEATTSGAGRYARRVDEVAGGRVGGAACRDGLLLRRPGVRTEEAAQQRDRDRVRRRPRRRRSTGRRARTSPTG